MFCGSLVAYDIDKAKSVVLINWALGQPASLALNMEYGDQIGGHSAA